MAQTNREQNWSHTVGIGRAELTQGQTQKLVYSASASTGHPYIDVPLGGSLIAFYHNNLSAGGSFIFKAAISASSTYRTIMKSDGSGNFSMVSASAARTLFIADAAPYRFIRPFSNKSFGSKRVFGWIVKG